MNNYFMSNIMNKLENLKRISIRFKSQKNVCAFSLMELWLFIIIDLCSQLYNLIDNLSIDFGFDD